MRPTAVLCAALAAAAGLGGPAAAHGRFPASTSIVFEAGDPGRLLLGTTFGLVTSGDDGATWGWICDEAIGYPSTFDPVLAVTAGGVWLATSYTGLSVSRDRGCSWTPAPDVGDVWVVDVVVGGDGAIWTATAAGGAANRVLVSRDGARSFAPALSLEDATFRSLAVAPSDPTRVYASGERVIAGTPPRVSPFLVRSDEGGTGWTELALAHGSDEVFELLGVAADDPQVVFGRLDGPASDTLVVSRDGGERFAPGFTVADDLVAFAALAGGETIVAGAGAGGVRVSRDGGRTWPEAPAPPQMACVGQRGDGRLFACGANFEPDRFALADSTDAVAWARRLRFDEIAGVVACPDGTPARTLCDPLWPEVRAAFVAPAAADAGPPDGATLDAGGAPPPAPGGCGCGVGLAALLVLPARGRRRRA